MGQELLGSPTMFGVLDKALERKVDHVWGPLLGVHLGRGLLHDQHHCLDIIFTRYRGLSISQLQKDDSE